MVLLFCFISIRSVSLSLCVAREACGSLSWPFRITSFIFLLNINESGHSIVRPVVESLPKGGLTRSVQ